jgi:hypothetical protein
MSDPIAEAVHPASLHLIFEVHVNGQVLATEFVASSPLQAAIDASSYAQPGDVIAVWYRDDIVSDYIKMSDDAVKQGYLPLMRVAIWP